MMTRFSTALLGLTLLAAAAASWTSDSAAALRWAILLACGPTGASIVLAALTPDRSRFGRRVSHLRQTLFEETSPFPPLTAQPGSTPRSACAPRLRALQRLTPASQT